MNTDLILRSRARFARRLEGWQHIDSSCTSAQVPASGPGHTSLQDSNMSKAAHIAGRSFGAADFLYLAAAPTFAIMALLTAVLGGGPAEALCGASSLGGMVPMYLLMSAFHTAPWLKLVSHRRSGARRSWSGVPKHKRPPKTPLKGMT